MQRIVNFGTICLSVAIYLLAYGTYAFGAENLNLQQTPKPAQIYKTEQLTKEQFKALPDNAVIEHKGKRETKKQYVAEQEQVAKARHEQIMKHIDAKYRATGDAQRAKFVKIRKDQIEANNARLMAKIKAENTKRKQVASRTQPSSKALSPQYIAIQKEALQLYARSQKATTPDERKQIDQRAGQLVQQLKQMGH